MVLFIRLQKRQKLQAGGYVSQSLCREETTQSNWVRCGEFKKRAVYKDVGRAYGNEQVEVQLVMREARAGLRHKGRKLCPEHEKHAPWRGWWTDTQTSVSYNLQLVPRHQRTPTGSHRAREPTGAVHAG